MAKIAVVIGAGIVGLHVAAIFVQNKYDVFILDKEKYLGEHTSGRNSGVIHSGIYYKNGSLKEKLCLEGNRLTYEWLKKLNVSHLACGKWVVPDKGQEDDINNFFEKICLLPIPKPQRYSAPQMAIREPGLRPFEAIHVPSTGIIDVADYLKKMSIFVSSQGAEVILNCAVFNIKSNMLDTDRGEIPFDICINSAGLMADQIAKLDNINGYEIKPCRGDYYIVNKKLISCPVYSLPHQGAHGLGVHVTPTIDNQTLFGPNAYFIENKSDYNHRSAEEEFRHSLQFYFPEMSSLPLMPAYSGNRPKLYYNGTPINDFTILKNDSIVHLLGIESPGLTSSPAIAREVFRLLS